MAPPDIISATGRKLRDSTPKALEKSPPLLARLRPWIRRDLKILLESESVDFVTELVLGIIKAHSIESSASLDALRPFLHDAAPIFMRELQLFASSPFDMKAHDDLRKAIRQASCSSDQSSRLENLGVPSSSPS
ncbi:uncharacterized protein BJ171DRAFT_626618 [Polychytrium aggregatum]|uniref:uncharacterized protein n=1 Tax=Polychytrium aggregatum TaxID=110093 RepID=UPI0022FE6510|nr:uncharacterized protein BJ171DRAFT_626618 [Polychytrium aggregatum]KAI9183781.1 hypothetical protein BJ171DRAFT_626618 [Polychytrium aggregatum]